MRDFLLDVGGKVCENTLVCIGITRHEHYAHRYELEKILGPRLKAQADSTDCLKKYEFLGADDDLVKSILNFGYLHTNVKDLRGFHDYIRDYHVTLVFRKKTPSESAGSCDDLVQYS